ncbi:MAG: 1-acyl-sn-glycerol-3-phosphate acyltransferase [Myxococcales bacterium]|nr:1-acyl-sn-glycerol-3-phosphate acyltransferase [Myxococcales bacterium]
MTLFDSLRAARLTARITVSTVADGLRQHVPPEVVDARLAWWAKEILREAHVTLHVRGVENIPAGEPLVVMSNHRSYYDIPAAFVAVPGRMRMVAKKELFRVPLFGRAMAQNGFIRVDRSDRKSAVESLNESRRLLAEGTRVWIAPEGTRSKDGRLGKFKSGGFHLALDAGARILPLVVQGTEAIMAHDSFVVHPGATVTVTILPPVDAPAYGHERRKELMADVRAAMERVLGG